MNRCSKFKYHEVYPIHMSKVVNETKDEDFIKRVDAILNEFIKVFCKDLNELPPTRDIDHAIIFVVDADLTIKHYIANL